MDGQSLKPAHIVKIGDLYTIQKDHQKKILKVLALLEKRVDEAKAAPFFEDLTPPELDPKFITVFNSPVLRRDRGTGRPTKRDRREIDDLQDSWD
jgi:ribosome-associated heat shock protein Hsp15